ncbi:hypothetical protein SWM_00750, partial [Staphylococcus aureus M0066]
MGLPNPKNRKPTASEVLRRNNFPSA